MSNYIINTTNKYTESYNKSISEPEKFWGELAKNNLSQNSLVIESIDKKAYLSGLSLFSLS